MGSILAAVLFFLPSSSSSSSALRDSALGYARLWHLRSLSMSIFLSLSLPHSLALRRFHIAVTEAAGLDPGAGEPAARPRRADDTGMPNRRGECRRSWGEKARAAACVARAVTENRGSMLMALLIFHVEGKGEW